MSARRPLNMFVVDEAYADFIDGYRSLADESLGGIVVVRSLTKFYAIPGLRLGYAVANPTVAGAIRTFMLPWSVNLLAQEAALEMLCDDDYRRRSVRLVGDLRRELARELSAIPGLYVYPSVANFLLVRLDRSDLTAPELAERLLRVGIAIRTFAPPPTTAGSARSARSGGSSGSANFPPGQHLNEDVIRLLVELGPGLRRLAKAAQPLDERFFRVAVRTEGENRRLCAALASVLGVSRRVQPIPRRAAALMIQGTSSNAGKSVLTAALCRILLRDGIRVAPFKSQNMSLNSFVTRDGGEMGRAQVVQAQACRLEPDVRMNPILLKPCSDTGCQVIVRGQPVGNMRVAEYVAYKPRAFSAARECYDSLAAEFDAIVLEGAGSPGEVNLKSHDIVNMRMAEYAEAPVLVVGDIDRGGVFASFVGTMEVLAPWERKRIAGWIVNRFRGNAGLLGPALDYTRKHTGRPVLGVVPYLTEFWLPQEDSVEFKAKALDRPGPPGSNGDATVVEIAVIDLPHISNFTDFDAFRLEGNVRLTIVRSADELHRPDAVILPGSKNTLGDLDYLRRSRLAERIVAIAAEGRRGNRGNLRGTANARARDPRSAADRIVGRELVRPWIVGCEHGHGERKNAHPRDCRTRGLRAGGRGLRNPSWPDVAGRLLARAPVCGRESRWNRRGCGSELAERRGRRENRRTDLGNVPARPVRCRCLSSLVHRPSARAAGVAADGKDHRAVRYRARLGSAGRNRPGQCAHGRGLQAATFGMRLEYQILAAVLLDLALGDPRWLPHPVRGIGRLARWLERGSRRILGPTRIAGLAASLGTYAAAGGAAWGVIRLAAEIHPVAADAASIVVIYTTIAAQDLARHAMAVFAALAAGDLVEARRRVGAIVGRDTDRLDEAGVVRAAVESVAESTVDGVTAPILFAVVGGPVGAMVYRAVNTLDSMFGHQDEQYRQFGWAAARIDDLANYVPARLTAPLVCLAAAVLRLRPGLAVRTLLRDGRKHASPNSGLPEAAMAGALGVQLGGVNYYDGQPLEKPTIGDAVVPLAARHIRQANALMFVTTGLFLAAALSLRAWRAAECGATLRVAIHDAERRATLSGGPVACRHAAQQQVRGWHVPERSEGRGFQLCHALRSSGRATQMRVAE